MQSIETEIARGPVRSGNDNHARLLGSPTAVDLLKTASTASGLLGGFILLSYFFTIEYFPIFDFKAAASLLLSLAFVCSILLLVFTLLLVVPQMMVAQYLLRRGAPVVQKKRLDRELGLMSSFCWISQVFGLAAILGLDRVGMSIEASLGAYAIVCLLFYAFCWWLTLLQRVERRRGTNRVGGWITRLRARKSLHKTWLSHLGTAALISFVNIVPLMLVFLVMSRASRLRNADLLLATESMIAALIIVAAFSGIVLAQIWRQRSRWLWYGIAAMTIALPLIFNMMLGASDMFPMLVAHITKVGNIRASEIAISGKACANLPHVLGIACPTSEAIPTKLCDIHVLSRVGTETYLLARMPGKDPLHILIPSDQILSIAFDRKQRPLDFDALLKDTTFRTAACGTMR